MRVKCYTKNNELEQKFAILNGETLTLFPTEDLILLAPQKLKTKLMLIPRRRLKDAFEETEHPKRNDLIYIPISEDS